MSGTMKAARFKRGGAFELAEVPVPVPGPGEAVVRVKYCGICGSDLHMVDKGMLPQGAVIGHELTGTVEAVGEGVAGFAPGAPVAVMPLAACGKCAFCASGRTQLCQDGLNGAYGLGGKPGGFAQFMLVKSSMLYSLPLGLDLKTAALNEPWSVARHAVAMISAGPVLILGAGPIGLMSVYALREREIDAIFVYEPDPHRAGLAKRAGARVIDPAREKPAVVLAQEAGGPPPVVLDCAGAEKSMQEAAGLVAPAGTVLMLGINMAKTFILPIVCFGKEITIKFSFGYTAAEFGDSLLSLASSALDPSVLISAVMPLSDINKAFQSLHQPGQAKVLIDCS